MLSTKLRLFPDYRGGEGGSTRREARGGTARQKVYGGIVDLAATLALSANPRTRCWSTIAHDRTSRGKSDQAICTRMN